MFAFHVAVPPRASELVLTFQVITPQAGQNDVVMTVEMAVLDWNTVLLYPGGRPAAGMMVNASLRTPVGWNIATALTQVGESRGENRFATTSLTTLIDSPVMSGRFLRTIQLSDAPVPVRLNIAATDAAGLALPDGRVEAMRNLVAQAYALFGSHHFDHYDALFWLSREMGGKGLEHHQSSEDGVDPTYFTDVPVHVWMADLLAHEFTHSWNGKFRVPRGTLTPTYDVPVRNDLL